LSVGVQAIGHGLVLVGRVDDGRTQGALGWLNTLRLA
jgi:hypothetical protein